MRFSNIIKPVLDRSLIANIPQSLIQVGDIQEGTATQNLTKPRIMPKFSECFEVGNVRWYVRTLD